MTKKMRALLERKEELVQSARQLDETAADRELTAEEQSQFDAYMGELDQVNASIKREQRLIDEETSMQALETRDGAHVEIGRERAEDDPRRGFESYGEFCRAVYDAQMRHTVDQRLTIGAAAPSTYGSEAVGEDGGFLVPPEFSREIYQLSLEEDAFLPLSDNVPVGGNSMTFPADETTPWGTDGIRAYWEAEASQATATKPKLEPRTMRLHKLFALVPVTDELIADAGALSTYLMRKSATSIRWKTNDSLVNGSGAGQPEGVFKSGALVTVAKEGSQSADTIVANNILKIYARMPAAMRGRAVWLINQDAEPQLYGLTIGNQPMFLPPGSGMRSGPVGGSLMGRPVFPTQTAQTVGDKGDIMFVDWGSYRTITKRGGIETATSIHLYFDAGATAFRVIFRVDGEPAIRSAISPARGTNNLSPFITLAERA